MRRIQNKSPAAQPLQVATDSAHGSGSLKAPVVIGGQVPPNDVRLFRLTSAFLSA